MDFLLFLGTGGGRYITLNQILATGGIILCLDNLYFHIDPGPGALVRAKEFKFDLKKVEVIVVSHCHPDHYNDAEILIEVVSDGCRKKRGILIGNEYCIRGSKDKEYIQIASNYHFSCLEKVIELKPKEEIEIKGIKVKAVKTIHSEPKGLGFIFESKNKRVGYTGDGIYFEGQEEYFKNCDVLILNTLRPRGDRTYKHMSIDMAEELIEKAKPKLAILQHFGGRLLFGIAHKEAKAIENKTGIKTIAAKDGQRIEL